MLMAGGRFTLLRDPFTGAGDVEYILRAVSHHGSDQTWLAGAARSDYGNAFAAFPASVTWRQRQTLRRPQMAGIFAAVVLGNDGEEIHADPLGRIKVRLLWDHRADTVAGQAVWVRVVQPWAGDSWGWQHLPRVGTEVAVAFMDGDPDRPVVVGGFYNAGMALPFAVPGEQTKSGLRSRSSSRGGTANFSEFSIDDKIGGELVYLHAEKDMTREVEHDDALSVGHAQTITIQSGRTATIAAGGDALTVQDGDLTMQIATGKVRIEAAIEIKLVVGDCSVTIDQTGVSVKGMLVKVEGEAMVQASAPLTQVKGDAMLTLSGGLVTVN
jgi:type VI secretion system secreted protein VgrG